MFPSRCIARRYHYKLCGACGCVTTTVGLEGIRSIRLWCKIFKLIKCERVIAEKTNSSRENEYTFYTFYLCWIVEYAPF